MKASTLLSAVVPCLLAGLPAVRGFTNTFPLVAVASEPLNSLSLLSSSRRNPFAPARPVAAGQPQSPFSTGTTDDDLCAPSAVLVLSVQGLHVSDLALLPSVEDSPSGLKALLNEAKSAAATSSSSTAKTLVEAPYLPSPRSAITGPSTNPAERYAEAFLHRCKGATLEAEGFANFWAGGREGKVVRLVEVEGLEGQQLGGYESTVMRKEVMSRVDYALQAALANMPPAGPFVVILTSMPSSSLAVLRTPAPIPSAKLAKRQFIDDDLEDDDEIAPAQKTKNPYTPSKHSGLLHRYVFFTPALIFCLLVTLLLFIPLAILGSNALLSIETLQGLETKMKGSAGVDQAKSASN